MVQPRRAGTTGERSHRRRQSSPQTTLGGCARGAQILLPMLRQRGKRCLDPIAIRPARATILRRVGRFCRPRSTRRSRHQGRGMQPSGSRMPSPWGAADPDPPRSAKQRGVAGRVGLRPVSSRGRILDAIPRRHVAAAAVRAARAPLAASVRGRRRVRRGPAPRRAISRVLNGFLFLKGEDSSAWAQRLIVLRRLQMPSLPALPGDSQLGARADLTPPAWKVAGPARRPAALPMRRVRGAWLDPAVVTVHRRHPLTAHSMPQRR
jgi:hypothetical protein